MLVSTPNSGQHCSACGNELHDYPPYWYGHCKNQECKFYDRPAPAQEHLSSAADAKYLPVIAAISSQKTLALQLLAFCTYTPIERWRDFIESPNLTPNVVAKLLMQPEVKDAPPSTKLDAMQGLLQHLQQAVQPTQIIETPEPPK